MKKFIPPQPVVMTGDDPFYPTIFPTFVHNPVKGSDLPIRHGIDRSNVSFMQRNFGLLDIVFPKLLNFAFFAA